MQSNDLRGIVTGGEAFSFILFFLEGVKSVVSPLPAARLVWVYVPV